MSWTQDTVDYFKKMGSLNPLMGMLAIETTQDSQEELRKNREAESRWARKSLWGDSEEPKSGGDDDVRQTAAGNIETHYHYEAPPEKKSSGLAKTALLSAGIAAAGASAGFGPAIVAALTSDKVTERVETKTEVIEGESSSERLEIGEPIIRRPEGR